MPWLLLGCLEQHTNKTTNVAPALLGCSLSDQLAPIERPKKPSSRKIQNAPLVGARSLAMFLSVFCNLSGVAPFSLSSQKDLTQRLRRFRGFQGELQSNKLPPLELEQLQLRLKSSTDTMTTYAETTLGANVKNMCTGVVDSGCSFTTLNSFEWVDPSSIRRLAQPIRIDGIAGGLNIEYFGVADMEVLLPNGKVQPFPLPCLIHESLPQVLVNPQAFLKACHAQGGTILSPEEYIEMAENTSPSDYEQHFRIFHDRSEWYKDGQKLLDLKYDSSFLPRITMFRKGTALSTTKSLFCAFQSEAEQGAPPLTLPNNRNLSVYKKLLLLWHARLGHISMGRVLEFAMKGLLSNEAKKMHPDPVGVLPTSSPIEEASTSAPLCGSCLCGKQKRKPDGTTITSKNPDTLGNLIKGKLVPGECVFGDQLESPVRGRLFHTAGKEPDKDRYRGASIWIDAASSYIHTELQVTLNGSDTIVAKDNFEKDMESLGVRVQSYHTDNGIYVSMPSPKNSPRTTKLSGSAVLVPSGKMARLNRP